jgi:hypothetical protein
MHDYDEDDLLSNGISKSHAKEKTAGADRQIGLVRCPTIVVQKEVLKW